MSVQNSKKHINKTLQNLLVPRENNNTTPKFYGIPKVHKDFQNFPPVRPIIAQTGSPLAPSARFIDHVLQPIARSYADYIYNSTTLINMLDSIFVPEGAILVTIDVVSLYPSIPQTECLRIIYEEMFNHRPLLLTDPNLIIQLLHININFLFAGLCFQQIHGTAMGAAFSPTIANIFMSVTLARFLRTQKTKPLLLARYIDDIFMIWPNKESLDTFLLNLNSYHPHLNFTHNSSKSTIDFLDLTVYKGPEFPATHKLDIKTFQKPQNLYQYLEYTSAHPRKVFRAIILGECKRYLRTNTRQETYMATITTFKKRLQERQYPSKMIGKITSRVNFSDRKLLLSKAMKRPSHNMQKHPIFKCLPPPWFNQLRTIILQQYQPISRTVPTPVFITLAHESLRKMTVKAKIKPTTEQLFDILVRLQDTPHSDQHVTAGNLPKLRDEQLSVRPCHVLRCSTCAHLNSSQFFSSTVTKRTYPIRFTATCSSSNVIYLVTCTKCKKQYVGLTTMQLKTRINHHRSNIFRKKPIYLCRHFNFADHSIHNLSDKATTLEDLRQLEKFWIETLHTLQPKGLNCNPGFE